MPGPTITAPIGRSRETAVEKGWRIVVGSDNAGVGYKDELKAMLQRDPRVASVDDVGVGTRADATAYAHVAVAAARKIAAGEADRALLFCGTGMGVAIQGSSPHALSLRHAQN